MQFSKRHWTVGLSRQHHGHYGILGKGHQSDNVDIALCLSHPRDGWEWSTPSFNQLKIPCPGRLAQLTGAWSHIPKVAGLIPSQGTYLGCGFDPWSGHMQEATH